MHGRQLYSKFLGYIFNHSFSSNNQNIIFSVFSTFFLININGIYPFAVDCGAILENLNHEVIDLLIPRLNSILNEIVRKTIIYIFISIRLHINYFWILTTKELKITYFFLKLAKEYEYINEVFKFLNDGDYVSTESD